MTLGIEAEASVHFGELAAQVGRLSRSLDERAQEERRERETARARVAAIIRIQASATCPTPTASFGINLGGPDVGSEWVVRRLVVGGLTWTTTAAGSVEAYLTGLGAQYGTGGSGAGTIASVRSLSDLFDQAATMPYKTFYGREQVVVKETESLVAVVVGGTAGQVYSAAISVQAVRTVARTWGASQGM